MNICILWATYSGGTEIAGQTVSEILKSSGHTVTVQGPADFLPDTIKKYDCIVLCTPTWDYQGKEGQPHEDFISFVQKAKGKIWTDKPFAILGLGDSSYTHFCGSVGVLEEFVIQSKGKIIIPSLKIDGFFFSQDKHLESIRLWSGNLLKALAS